MNVGFTGTQQGLAPDQDAMLTNLLRLLRPATVHHGDCVGADAEFVALVRRLFPEVWVVAHPPSNIAKRAFTEADVSRPVADYLDRNHQMVDEVDMLIACPKEQVEVLRSGTWATVRYARKRNVPVHLLLPDGGWVTQGVLT